MGKATRLPLPISVGFLVATLQLPAEPTWSSEVATIVGEKCARCHRAGDIAPFALTTFDEASTWAADIARVVENRTMPPWKPVPGHGSFRGDFGLTDEQRQTILDWVRAGAPQGDSAAAPEPLPGRSEWELGEPGVILTMPEPFPVNRGKDTYRCFVLPTGLTEDRFVDAIQVRPGNRSIVHHVILFLDSTGEAEKLDAAEPGPGYNCFGGPGIDIGTGGLTAVLDLMSTLGGWAPGSRTQRLPEGVGLFLPKAAKIVMQVHYYSAGRPSEDQTSVGLYLMQSRAERRMRYLPVLNTTFAIPAGERRHEVRSALPIPPLLDAKLIQIVPHMHLLGREIQVELERRGTRNSLIYISDWDFNWQGFYTYSEAVPLPAGSIVRLTCRFDNSADNPRNPNNPLRTVRWGEATEDEMCVGFLGVTFDRENLLPFSRQVRK